MLRRSVRSLRLRITFPIHQLIANYCLAAILIGLMMLRWDRHRRTPPPLSGLRLHTTWTSFVYRTMKVVFSFGAVGGCVQQGGGGGSHCGLTRNATSSAGDRRLRFLRRAFIVLNFGVEQIIASVFFCFGGFKARAVVRVRYTL